MIALFIALTIVAGFVLAYVTSKAWVAWVTIWLCVPLGMVLFYSFGWAREFLGICSLSPVLDADCSIFGKDFSFAVDNLQVLGYYFGLIAFPWFTTGLVLFFGLVAFRVIRRLINQ